MDALHLTWGMPHTLNFFRTEDGLRAEMHVIKPKGSQTIHVDVPANLSLSAIESAWERQNKKWLDLFVHSSPPFVAIRVIWIDVDYCLLWHVIHINDRPHDVLNFVHMNTADWPFETLKVVTVP